MTALTGAGHRQLPQDLVKSAAAALSVKDGSEPSTSGRPGLLYQLGTWSLSKGDLSAAATRFKDATQGAAAAKVAAAGQPAPLISELHWTELEAAALLGSAQIAIVQQDWKAAETMLSDALKAAEAVSTEQHPRVAAVLLLLGKVYARTARIMFAEGLYRECAKLMRLDSSGKLQRPGLVHPSLAAMLAWQYHQLLSTLPNRGTEASAWAECSRQLWPKAGTEVDVSHIEAVLGSTDHLKGTGQPGAGLAVCLDMRRGFEAREG